jgi:uncharacterized protein YjlB
MRVSFRPWVPAAAILVSGAWLEARQSAPLPVPGNTIELPHAWPGRRGAALVLENERGAMWNVTFVQDVGSHWHKHLYEFAGVELTAAAFSVTNPDGVTRVAVSERGRMWILPKGLTHMERGLSPVGRTILIVDVKDAPSPAYSNTTGRPGGGASARATLANENARIAQWDVTLSSDVQETSTFYPRDCFVGVVDGGTLRIVEGTEARTVSVKSGDGLFLRGGVVRRLEAADGRIRLMVVELK